MSDCYFFPKNKGRQFATPLQTSIFTKISELSAWNEDETNSNINIEFFTEIQEQDAITSDVITSFKKTPQYTQSKLPIITNEIPPLSLQDQEIFETKHAEFEFFFTFGNLPFVFSQYWNPNYINAEFFLLKAIDPTQFFDTASEKQQDETDDQFNDRIGSYNNALVKDYTVQQLLEQSYVTISLPKLSYNGDFYETNLLKQHSLEQSFITGFQSGTNAIQQGDMYPKIFIQSRNNTIPLITNLHKDTRFLNAYSQLRLYTIPSNENTQTVNTEIEFTNNGDTTNIPLVMITCPPSDLKCHAICPPTYNLPCYFNEEYQHICLENFNPFDVSQNIKDKIQKAYQLLPSALDSPVHNKELAVLSCTILVSYMVPKKC